MYRAPYTQSISRQNKACFLFLLDQSFSMEEPLGNSPNRKCDELAAAINGWLQNMAIRASGDEGIKDWMDVGVFGYRTDNDANMIIEPALLGELAGRRLVSIPEIGANPARIDTRNQFIPDEETGEMIQVPCEMPVWVDPVTEGGTPMCHMLYQAHEVLSGWIAQHPRSFPPIVVHITDGESQDGDPTPYADAIKRLGKAEIEARYGNLFQMYEKIVAEDPYQTPMMIYPASHYTMGGLWVDYNLMSTLPGLFVLGEANFSDHGANRLGASALMQGLADGYFIIPNTISGYLAGTRFPEVNESHPAFQEAESAVAAKVERLLKIRGRRTVTSFHRDLGNIMWEYCGMGRTDEGLAKARTLVADLRGEFWENVTVPGSQEDFNQSLENAGRVADFLEFADVMLLDALARRESCGCHFNEAFQTEEHEALRDDVNMCHVAVWEYAGEGREAVFHKEPLLFEFVKLATRSYK